MAGGVKVGKLNFELNPRGNLWFNDESTLGHKLLAKMGWSKGKGLGKNEDGIKENIKVSKRDTRNGVGFENQHIPAGCLEYENILQNLQKRFNNRGIVNSNSSSHPKNELESLEQRSKKAKNHLHYQKYVRGKDLMRFSDKELKCIFLDEQNKPEELLPTDSPTFKSQLSVQDYFASKMQKKLGKTSKKEQNGKLESSYPTQSSFKNETYINKRKFVSESPETFKTKRFKKSDSDNDSKSFPDEKRYPENKNPETILKKNKYPNFVSSSYNEEESEIKKNDKSGDKRKNLKNINFDDNNSSKYSDEELALKETSTETLSKNKKFKENSIITSSTLNEGYSQWEMDSKSVSKKKKIRKIDSGKGTFPSSNREQEVHIKTSPIKKSRENLDNEDQLATEELIKTSPKRKKLKKINSDCSVISSDDDQPPLEENTVFLSKIKRKKKYVDSLGSPNNEEQSDLSKNSRRKKLKNKNSVDRTHNLFSGEMSPVETNEAAVSKHIVLNKNLIFMSSPYNVEQSQMEENSVSLSKRKKCKKLYSDKESYLEQIEVENNSASLENNKQWEKSVDCSYMSEKNEDENNIKCSSERKKLKKKNSIRKSKKINENSEDELNNFYDELLVDTNSKFNSKRKKSKSKTPDGDLSCLSNIEHSDSLSSDDSSKRKTKSKKSKSRFQQLKSCLKNENNSDNDNSRNVSFNEQVSCKILDTSLELCEELNDHKTNSKILSAATFDDSVLDENADDTSYDYPVIDYDSDDILNEYPIIEEEECSANEETTRSSSESEFQNELSFSDDSNEPGMEKKNDITDEQSPNCLDLPKCTGSNFNFWLESQRQASKMKLYREMLRKMKNHKIIRSTNLLDIKGYGNWGI